MNEDCSCSNDIGFSKVDEIGPSQLINQLEENMKAFLNYGFLDIGGFVNVHYSASGLYGGSFDKLMPNAEPPFTDGRMYRTPKKDIVYESGMSYNGISPIPVTGVIIDNQFVPGPTGNSQYGFTINYPEGYVLFNQPLQSNAEVYMAYSYRWIQVYKSSASPYWKELQELSYKPGGISGGPGAVPAPHRTDGDSCAPMPVYNGNCEYVNPNLIDVNGPEQYTGYSNSINRNLQMPCIVVEPVARSDAKPYQLGCVDHWIDQDILLHVFAENGIDKNRICDIIRLQRNKTICLYDQNKVANSGVNPLNWDGSINQNGLSYASLVTDNDYVFTKCYFKDIKLMDMESSNKNLYWCTIRVTTEVIL
jgi:hypothetical protein